MAENIIEPIVTLVNGVPTTTSLNVAERFEKNHKEILRAIQNILSEIDSDFGRRNFAPSSYKNSQGKEQPCYTLTRDGFSLLAMGFTGKAALSWKIRYIEAFNAMEAELAKKLGGDKKQIAEAPVDPYEACAAEVEAVRKRTIAEVERLLRLCMKLINPKRHGVDSLQPWANTFQDWLYGALVSHSEINVNSTYGGGPIGLARELAKVMRGGARRH